jgi:hypothetical protein
VHDEFVGLELVDVRIASAESESGPRQQSGGFGAGSGVYRKDPESAGGQ